MADVIRFSFHSLRFSSSSSFLTSVSSSLTSLQPGLPPIPNSDKRVYPLLHSSSSARDFARFAFTPRKQLVSLKVRATVTETNQPKWWERNAPNMVDIHSTQDFLSALGQAGERLVIAEFYGTWCASCRALFPKLCRTAEEHPEILFLKINFDENKPMCKSMNVKVLPYFHFYRGADGQLEAFSCSLAKTYKNDMIFLCFLATKSYTLKKEDEFQKIKDAIQTHSTARCSIGPPKGVGDLKLEPSFAPNDKTSGSTSA